MVDLLGMVGTVAERVLDALRLRRRVRVRTRLGFLPTAQAHRLLVLTEVTNVGQRRVVVNSWGFNLNRRPHAMLPAGSTRPLPPTLEDGDQVVTWVRSDVFARQLQAYGYRGAVKVQAWVTDTSGTTHRGDT